jgi:O-antigen/teichoic acid export membrane protein
LASDAAVVPAQALSGLSLRTSARWAWTGTCAVLDQGLFALSNFVVSIALARWLPPESFGAFTLAYAMFLVFGTVHTALIAEPLIVFGSGRFKTERSAYLAVLERGHWIVTATGALVLALIGVALLAAHQSSVYPSFFAIAVSTPFLLFLWLMRRACYVCAGPQLAALGGALHMGLLIGGSYLLLHNGWMSAPAALLLMGAGSALTALWIKRRLTLQRSSLDSAFTTRVLETHWQYGRWAVGTGVLGALMLNVYYVVLPIAYGLESAATLRALTNFALPAMQAYFALSVVMVPVLVRMRGTAAFAGTIRRLALLYGAAALLYWLLVGAFHQTLVNLLYQGQYRTEAHLLWLLGLVPLTSAGVSVFEGALRSLERAEDIFRAYVLAGITTVVVGLPCTLVGGPTGAAFGLLVSASVAVASLVVSLRARINESTIATGPGHEHDVRLKRATSIQRLDATAAHE